LRIQTVENIVTIFLISFFNSEFCETCVAVDPEDAKVFTEKIIFSTGCATEICIADLQLTAKDVRLV